MTIDLIIEKYGAGEIDKNVALRLLKLEEKRSQGYLKNNNRVWFGEPLAGSPERTEWLKTKTELENIQALISELEQEGDAKAPDVNRPVVPIVWNGSQADLARIYKTLNEGGHIKITAREFSFHFTDKDGNPMPVDFIASLTGKQPEYSNNQAIKTVQKMKPLISKPETNT